MGFRDVFVKVWQVRTSVKIQESIENSFMSSKRNAEIQANIPNIINALDKKNKSWDEKIKQEREKE
jgi:hypothetical protein